jgi:cellulose synthase (UDP-forming)
MLVVGAIYVLAPALPLSRTWARSIVIGMVWLFLGRYHYWRLFDTVLPARGEWFEIAWVWFCYFVEMAALVDTFILYLMFVRTSDRSAEADRHEARLRATASAQLPSVDVYIPTYNEPLARIMRDA